MIRTITLVLLMAMPPPSSLSNPPRTGRRPPVGYATSAARERTGGRSHEAEGCSAERTRRRRRCRSDGACTNAGSRPFDDNGRQHGRYARHDAPGGSRSAVPWIRRRRVHRQHPEGSRQQQRPWGSQHLFAGSIQPFHDKPALRSIQRACRNAHRVSTHKHDRPRPGATRVSLHPERLFQSDGGPFSQRHRLLQYGLPSCQLADPHGHAPVPVRV